MTASAGSAWAREKRFADVLGRRMACVERGEGHPIVFLHGNPTSSFLWRNLLPHLEAPGRRLIAPDLIGMGLHLVQEDSPDEVGRAIAGWLERI